MARPTNILGLISELVKMPSVEKRIDVASNSDGMSALIRTKDGNAYEVVIRPAQDAKNPLFRKRIQ